MENDAATLYCPNEHCQASNPLTHKFCQQCRTPLPKRYLWVEAEGLSVASPGEILADRYLVISKSVVLDTKPGFLPQMPELENLQAIKPYLRLIPYRLHIPQVYGVLPLTDGQSQKDVLLLERPPLVADDTGQEVQLCSQLTTAWGNATSIRQINWLWQIAHLWQPLWDEGVVSSLLDPYLLRVEGSLVRLLELHSDPEPVPNLPQLGEFWLQLLPETRPEVAEFIQKISNSLIKEEIRSTEQLIAVLDPGLAELGRSQKPTIKIFTKTDTGRTRQRNEDACYPPSDILVSKPPQPSALAIVCDGIGGHEGGNVASNLAIETIQQQLQQLTKIPADHIDPLQLIDDLEKAVANANDKISQRNDSENRQGRQRMGTTLVMGLPIAHEMYITHVGDSRAYWITRHGCYQVTLDDDVASREVRLGYAVYREAIHQSGAGSLIQALGMSPSTSLHPTTQRFILDEDAVFLLTSDGLSDFDRVEEYWETEILPILTGESDVANVAERLIEIANDKNGHDNVTIALVHCQVKHVEPGSNLTAVIPERFANQTVDTSRKVPDTILGSGSQKTKVIPDNKPAGSFQLPLHLIVPLILVAAAAALGYWVKEVRSPAAKTPTPVSPSPTSQPNATVTPDVTEVPVRSLDNLAQGWVIQTTKDIKLANQATLSSGTFLQVIEIKQNSKAAGVSLVRLRLCPNPNTPKPEVSQPIEFVQSQLKRFGNENKVTVLPVGEKSLCDDLPPSPASKSPAPTAQNGTSVTGPDNR
ncbi:PP2C family serine/threonine-protein phosphatase [Calothrix sp. PCC 7507]|uniref:PP2C family serine/threonine-protein phosphatase n=1 Tax=Calothrix sp. PCC 7507 TaxID=99598 RepID=UPI00029EEBA5|nr:PP2C family serine/threonine-protein phosphatase [Calothrix sp. PCC 7507]AFY32562.1 protein serine/threonine phosphatase [Calothrix sp. PCC 7507]